MNAVGKDQSCGEMIDTTKKPSGYEARRLLGTRIECGTTRIWQMQCSRCAHQAKKPGS
jgi:hypothetical protein